MTVHIRHNSKNVPRYIKNALSDVISGYLLPALQATTTVHPSPRLSKERRDASTLNIALTRNDTVRLHLSTPSTSYVLNNVKLPTILQSLPVGTPEIPLIAKMHHLARRKFRIPIYLSPHIAFTKHQYLSLFTKYFFSSSIHLLNPTKYTCLQLKRYCSSYILF